jgi:hypothetical protein
MKSAALCSFVLLGSFFAVARAGSGSQDLIRTPLDQVAVAPEAATRLGIADEESWFVEASGSGETSVLARDEAVREALRSTMGALIMAETILEDGDVMEKIVSYTDGFLEDYVALEEEERGELWHVRIMAQVRPGKLESTLDGVGVSTRIVKGKVLATRARFKLSQRKSAGLMIRKAMSDLKGTLDAKVMGEPELGKTTADSVELLVPVRVRVVSERYQDWCDHYLPWFEKLADKHASAPYPAGIREKNYAYELRLHQNVCEGVGIPPPSLPSTQTLLVDSLDLTRFWVFHFDLEGKDHLRASPYRCYRSSIYRPMHEQGILTGATLPVWKLSFFAGGAEADEVIAPVIVGERVMASSYGAYMKMVWAAPYDSYRVCPTIPFGRWKYACFDLRQNRREKERDLVVSVEMPLDALERFEKCSVSLCWPEWK